MNELEGEAMSADRHAEEFSRLILGQEAIVPVYGLGRITSFCSMFPNEYIGVTPYIAGYAMHFDPQNVELVQIPRD